MTADAGNINVYGLIDASAGPAHTDGGTVELYARNDVNIGNNNIGDDIDGKISATGVKGGDVILSSADGWINVNDDGVVDVSDSTGGPDGTVYLRAQRNGNNNDVNINLASGSITGATAVYAEAFKTYNYDVTPMSTWIEDAAMFYNNNLTLDRLAGAVTNFHLLPGVEAYSSGDINWSAAWDQHQLSSYDDNGNIVIDNTLTRFGSEPGVLTVRAKGNLIFSQNLVDRPDSIDDLTNSLISPGRNSWGFNLVAGADISSADFMSVTRNGAGSLSIADQTVVYTENAPIHFASAGDTEIGSGLSAGYMINKSMHYNLASYGGSIKGYAGRDLKIAGGAVQTATGDIDIKVGRDLQLNFSDSSLGAIRTTGQLNSVLPFGEDSLDPAAPIAPNTGLPSKLEPPLSNATTYYWRYVGDGDITLM